MELDHPGKYLRAHFAQNTNTEKRRGGELVPSRCSQEADVLFGLP